jgi:pentatricopeptide repeat protein
MGVYARRKLFRKCMSLFQKMTQAGCTPDAATAKVLLSSCRSPEQVQEVSDMIDKLKPSVFT